MALITLNKLVIIGVGLIGGSFGLAIRKAGIASNIVGVGRSQENMQRALALGVIDEIATDLTSALEGADFILLAMPVGQTEHIMAQIAPCLEHSTVISDAGSTKQDVVAAARNHLGVHLKNFVPGHPIAGAEYSGVLAAQNDLYINKHVILTPIEETQKMAIELTSALWLACGAKVSHMRMEEHDEILAATSHLPHILAFTLMNYLHKNSYHSENLLRFVGSGFRDFTRIASSSPEMWRDICLANREALIKQIIAYQEELSCLQSMLTNSDGKALKESFSQARKMREDWLNRET